MVLRYRVLGDEKSMPTLAIEPDQAVASQTEPDRPIRAASARRSKAPWIDRGMSLRRIREKYFRVAATLVRSGRTLTTRLAVGARNVEWRMAWMAAWKAAGQL